MLERLITNLIDNAAEYNDARAVVEVRTGSAEDEVYVTVLNTGPPVPPSQLDRLFEPFQRLESRRPAGGGHHGLGLSIVSAIATAHGARLVAQPRAEGGLEVTVYFQRA